MPLFINTRPKYIKRFIDSKSAEQQSGGTLPTLLLVMAVTVLMQVHGVQFWVSTTQAETPIEIANAVLWSLTLEGAMLWTIWQRAWLITPALALIVIGGPLYILSQPVIETLSKSDETVHRVQIKQRQLDNIQANLERYRANSDTINRSLRQSMSQKIEQAQADFDRISGEIEALAKTGRQTNQQAWHVAMIQASGLLLLMVSQITALVVLRNQRERRVEKNCDGSKIFAKVESDLSKAVENEIATIEKECDAAGRIEKDCVGVEKSPAKNFDAFTPNFDTNRPNFDTKNWPVENPTSGLEQNCDGNTENCVGIAKVEKDCDEDFENCDGAEKVEKLAEAIEKLVAAGKPRKEIAQEAGVQPKDLSLLKTHRKRNEQGKETISVSKLRNLERYLIERSMGPQCKTG
jgi:hypothetical protein